MVWVCLPLVFQEAQRLVERQQLATQLLFEALGCGEQLGLHARSGLATVHKHRITRADPGQRGKQQSGNDDNDPAETANRLGLDRRAPAAIVPQLVALADNPLLWFGTPGCAVPGPRLIPFAGSRGKKPNG